jgi:uncharacterized membrane protein YozB (DUF420 family)
MTHTVTKSTERPKRKARLRPGMYLLAVVVLGFLAFSVPNYLTFDPANSRVPIQADVPWHYPLLVAHVLFATVAMVLCWFQIWPWFQRTYRAAHRRMGRIYVFGGVVPAGITALAVGVVSPFGPMNRVGNVLLGLLWLLCTAAGFRAARQRRFGDHRRWMIRSFALTMSIVMNRVWTVIGSIVLTSQLKTTFGGSEIAMQQTISGLSSWLGFVTSMLIAQWWLERKPKRGGKTRGQATTTSVTAPMPKVAR